MATDTQNLPAEEDQSSALIILRPLRRLFLVIAIMALAVTAVFIFLRLPSTIVPAGVFVVSYGIFALTALLEHSARFRDVTPPIEVEVGQKIDTSPGHVHTTRDAYPQEAFRPPPPEIRAAEAVASRAESNLGFKIIAVIAIAALVLAAALMGSKALAVGALIIFLVLALFGGPFWLAATQEKAEDERRRAGRP